MNAKNRSSWCRVAALIGGLYAGSLVAPVWAATNGWNQTVAGTYDYNTVGNWVGGVINDVFDSSLTNAGAETLTFAAGRATSGDMLWLYAGAYNYALRADGAANQVLTLGGNLSFAPVDTSRTLTVGTNAANQGLSVNLGGATRSFYVSNANQTITFANTLSNGAIVQSGAGAVNLGGPGSGGAAPSIDYAIPSYGTLKLGSGSTGFGATRVNSLTLGGASMFNPGNAVLSPALNVYGNSTSNNTEMIAGALTVAGYASIAMTPNGVKNVTLAASNLGQSAGGVLNLSGTGLGSVATNAPAANTSNIRFGTAPTLAGGGGASGSQNMSILPYARVGNDFVTYTANGLRALAAGEYANTFANNDNATNNVKVGASISNINNTATINALCLTGTPVTISGIGTLTVAAGAVDCANNWLTLSVSNLYVPNGLCLTTPGPNNNQYLTISSAISGSGGLTVCPAYKGYIMLSGANNNTYAGTTTINGLDYRDTMMILNLNKPLGYTAIPGDLVVNGGTVYWYGDNQMSTNGSMTVYRGSVIMGSGTEGANTHNQTFSNLTLLGSSAYQSGSGGDYSVPVVTQSVTGVMSMPGGTATIGESYWGKVTVKANQLVMSGGNLSVNSTAAYGDNSMSVGAGGLTITNSAAGLYTAVTINNSDGRGNYYGRLILNGDVNVVANAANANPVTFALAFTGAGGTTYKFSTTLPVIELNGTRSFTVGKGAGTADLAIQPLIQNNGANVGALIKAGPGTLRLIATNNSYSGGTTVNAGVLDVAGRLPGLVTVTNTGWLAGTGTVGSVVVASGGGLMPGGTNLVGTLNATGNVSLASGSMLVINVSGPGTNSAVSVGGGFTLGGTVVLNPLGGYRPTGSFIIITATNAISGSFSNVPSGFTAKIIGKTVVLRSLGSTVVFMR